MQHQQVILVRYSMPVQVQFFVPPSSTVWCTVGDRLGPLATHNTCPLFGSVEVFLVEAMFAFTFLW